MDHLVNLEQRALAHKLNGEFSEAVVLYLKIVEQQPDYEHGRALYNLANCYEDLGETAKAREHYERALHYGRGDSQILGGYASFLFLYGDPHEAFTNYLDLLRLEKNARNDNTIDSIKLALRELGRKIGMTEQIVDGRISFVMSEEDSNNGGGSDMKSV